MATPRIIIRFTLIKDDFDPQVVTERTGLKPTDAWRRGDHIPGTYLRQKHSAWRIVFPERSTFDFEALVIDLLATLEPFKEELLSVINEFELISELSVTVYFDDQTPSLYLSAKTIGRLAKLKCDLDIDMIGCSPS